MRIGIGQMDCKFKNKASNLDKFEEFIIKAKENSVDLLVFPECALNGYVYDNFDEAFEEAEIVPGQLTEKLVSLCHKYEITCLFGMLEKENDKIYNIGLLVSPEGIIGKYRKTHLLHLGVDRFATPGSDISVYNLPQARVAPLICYDLRSPEPSRVAALKGAQIILSPTNFPKGAEAYNSFFNKARGCENRVFIVSANRVGVEKGYEFIGKSQIVNNLGHVLAEASGDKEELIFADISPEIADIKHTVIVPDEYEFNVFEDRKPGLYDILVK